MFFNEEYQQTIYADLNDTLIRATLRPCDLVPAFLEAIRDTPEYAQIMVDMANNWDLKVITDPTADEYDERWESDTMAFFLNEELFDVLNSYAPEGFYFGAHEGDGSAFGYWETFDWLDGDLGLSDIEDDFLNCQK